MDFDHAAEDVVARAHWPLFRRIVAAARRRWRGPAADEIESTAGLYYARGVRYAVQFGMGELDGLLATATRWGVIQAVREIRGRRGEKVLPFCHEPWAVAELRSREVDPAVQAELAELMASPTAAAALGRAVPYHAYRLQHYPHGADRKVVDRCATRREAERAARRAAELEATRDRLPLAVRAGPDGHPEYHGRRAVYFAWQYGRVDGRRRYLHDYTPRAAAE